MYTVQHADGCAVEYEEDIEGFQFSRAPGAKRLRSSSLPSESESPEPEPEPQPVKKKTATKKRGRPAKSATTATEEDAPPPKTRTRAQMKAKPAAKPKENNMREVAVAVEIPAPALAATNGHANGSRRSKRLADEVSSTPAETEARLASRTRRRISSPDVQPQPIQVAKKRSQRTRTPEPEPEPEPADDYMEDAVDEEGDEDGDVTLRVQAATTSTKIALPMADTPVIRKNKEMRMKDKKKGGQRRSSLGMRGRRASSLIDSGVSNALPHDAVRTTDFYKHIEGEGLSEPRRMKQLLTWCATRALGEKPSGSRSEDESARLAGIYYCPIAVGSAANCDPARVIQEELLKELGSRSELSDWFSRQESTPPPVVVKKPNPKNVQNEAKLRELEEHIQRYVLYTCIGEVQMLISRRLQEERKSLAALLREPDIPRVTEPSTDEESVSRRKKPSPSGIDTSLLDPSQRDLLSSLNLSSIPCPPKQQPDAPQQTEPESKQLSLPTLSTHLSSLSLSLTPTLDTFASGIHDIELYRRTAGDFAGAVLRVCAGRLEERDKRMKRVKAENEDGDGDDGGGGKEAEDQDLSVVLGALSRLERRM